MLIFCQLRVKAALIRQKIVTEVSSRRVTSVCSSHLSAVRRFARPIVDGTILGKEVRPISGLPQALEFPVGVGSFMRLSEKHKNPAVVGAPAFMRGKERLSAP